MRQFRCPLRRNSRRSILLAALVMASPSLLPAADDDVQTYVDSTVEDLLIKSPSDYSVDSDLAKIVDEVEKLTAEAEQEVGAAQEEVAEQEEPAQETEPLMTAEIDGADVTGDAPEMIAETRPALVLPGKATGYRTQANSTLKMKPVVGPLFGRSNSRRPVLKFLQRQTAEPEKPEVANNPAVPKPKSMSHPEIAQRHQQQLQSSQRSATQRPAAVAPNLEAQRQYEVRRQYEVQRQRAAARTNAAPNHSPTQGWVSRGSALRDPESTPSYIHDARPIAPPPEVVPPKDAPAKVVPARPNPVQIAAPSLNAPEPVSKPKRRAEPILVSPTAPSKKTAPAGVPSQDVSIRKRSVQSPVTPKAQAKGDGIREQLQAAAKQRPERIASRDRNIKLEQPVSSHAGDLDSRAAQEAPLNLDYVGLPARPFRVSSQVRRMKQPIERVLQYFYDNAEIADGRSNWGMMHAIMVYGVDTQLIANNRRYSTIAWIAGNNICRGQRLLTHDATGIKPKSGVGLQGHQAQMLAVFSLCDVPANYPLYAGNTKYSVQDVINVEKRDCKSGEELTFTLIGLSHYLDTDAAWIAGDGQRWDFQRLIAEELSQPIVGTACGGTHRLMGFAHALRKRREEGKPIVGQWARAEYFLRDFVAYTYRLQNRDGSMSTNWFEGRGDNGNLDRKIQTTGHMVEFLLTVTPDSQLQDPRLVGAINFLMTSMHNDLGREWKIGPKGHALRSLAMYHDRVFKSGPAWRTQGTATASRGNLYR